MMTFTDVDVDVDVDVCIDVDDSTTARTTNGESGGVRGVVSNPHHNAPNARPQKSGMVRRRINKN